MLAYTNPTLSIVTLHNYPQIVCQSKSSHNLCNLRIYYQNTIYLNSKILYEYNTTRMSLLKEQPLAR